MLSFVTGRTWNIFMPDKKQPHDRYRAFLLRIWQTEEAASWRASLEDPHTGRTRGFASLEALFSYLETCTSEDLRTTLNVGNVLGSADR